MKSQNFEFLRPQYDVLADLGGFAEAYVHSDPPSALAKLRLQLELITRSLIVDGEKQWSRNRLGMGRGGQQSRECQQGQLARLEHKTIPEVMKSRTILGSVASEGRGELCDL